MSERQCGSADVLALLDAKMRPPSWLEVGAREDAFSSRVVVTFRVRSWWRRLLVSGHEREAWLVAAHVALADRPVGSVVSVRWA